MGLRPAHSVSVTPKGRHRSFDEEITLLMWHMENGWIGVQVSFSVRVLCEKLLLMALKLGFYPPPASTHRRRPLDFRRCAVQNSTCETSEKLLIDALIGIQGRGRSASPSQLSAVESAVKQLENLQGVESPTRSDLIEGRWQLMFTTRPATASPIQRTFVGVDIFTVFQEIQLRSNDPRVSNVVRFSDAIGDLRVEAAAAVGDGKRILFRFDRAAFRFKFLPFKVPYPVPFRLLGDEAKGWLDTTYLSPSGNVRISRGNKGTTFVLQKKSDPRQKLLGAISKGRAVIQEIDDFLFVTQRIGEEEPQLVDGEWQMLWSSQVETDSWLENAANGLMGTQIVKKNGELKFVVGILPGLRFSMNGKFVKTGVKKYDVTMDEAAIIGGPFGYPLEMETKINMVLLYNDDKIRISRGYNDIVFVHLRIDGSKQLKNS